MIALPHIPAELVISTAPVAGATFSWRVVKRRTLQPAVLLIVAGYGSAVIVSASVNVTHADVAALLSPAVTATVMAVTGSLLTRREFVAVGRVVVTVAAVQAVLAVLEVQLRLPWALSLAAAPDLGYYLARENLVLDGFFRAGGTMGHPILLGLVCAAGWVFVFMGGTMRHRPLRLGLLALLGWGVLLSGSRSALAALGFAVVFYLLHRRSRVGGGRRVLALLAVVPLTWLFVTGTVQEAQQVSPFSLDNRLAAFDRFLDTTARPGTQALFGESSNFTLDTVADNQLLTTSGRYGLAGLVFVLAAAIYAVTSRSSLLASVAALVVVMFLSFDVLSFSFTAVLFWLVTGAAWSTVSEAKWFGEGSLPAATRTTAPDPIPNGSATSPRSLPPAGSCTWPR